MVTFSLSLKVSFTFNYSYLNVSTVFNLPVDARCAHHLFWWAGQFLSVHHGHGASVHEGRGGETPASELFAAPPPESCEGEDQNRAGLAGASEKEAEGQRRR